MKKISFGVMLPVMVPSSPKPRSLYHALQYQYNKLDMDLIKCVTIEAERNDYHSVWVSDHLSREECKERAECWTTLTWLASITEEIRIGSMVLCNLYRHPGLIAKMASTLDILSDGRLEFGIGACWSEDECIDRGMEWPKPSKRLDMLRESVDICKKLWTMKKTTFKGKYYHFQDVYSEPKPLQKPHPPIMIGGSGEQITFKIVAEYADKSNFSGTEKIMKKKMEALENHCKKVGRDYASIEKSMNIGVVIHPTLEKYHEDMKRRWKANGSPGRFQKWLEKAEETFITGTPDMCVDELRSYVDLGVSLFVIRFGNIPDLTGLKLFADKVAPKI